MAEARVSRALANLGLIAATVLLVLVTRKLESVVTFVLPALAVNWMISNERRRSREGFLFAQVSWQAKVMIFVLPLAISLALLIFWFPSYARGMNPWLIYSIASFSMGLLLVKLYERFLSVRKKHPLAADPRQ